MEVAVKHKGLTLIELIIVVAILGIIAAIAYPSYKNAGQKTKRIEAQAELVNIAGQLQRFKMANYSFTPNGTAVTLASLGYAVNSSGEYSFAPNKTATYTITLNAVTANSWRLSARPVGGQLGNGYLGLNQADMRCWSSSDVMWCDPNSSTSWTTQSP
ncbi:MULTISPECIES: type IV pilin protein [Acinetobacter]|jgi:type IV pilus assembly protein PilE|uniref:Prepilin-type N-terminal cleavage/methylation domain-containing protein n=1 Tax=Acinetobacter chengduensis TaxID=2420890 RepID=A0ABX9TVB0_9GAMM|nr:MULTISPECIES: type IV pilin protein [Acinetobacter]MBI1451825.1 prepilin-type N-terminal cleavage/methylation domain-containing protein [Acinetobacter sp. FL51]RKG44160.1 prepilin-type N-terminal cleavage/methylation domain-containing protein [Acinetobacter sp. WCHAc060007]RLL21496.1 prepilin-type N-terminal cleavage/methylation domain-containing protein [Acinetobacter chengduensis]